MRFNLRGKERHQWAYVYHPDEARWYAVDVTWDNSLGEDTSVIQDLFFMVGANTKGTVDTGGFSESHIPDSWLYNNQATVFQTPALAPSKYEEFYAWVEYSTTKNTNKNVTVIINGKRELKEIDGWKLSSDKKSMQKEYTQNTTEDIIVTNVRNESDIVEIEIDNIDKEPPELNVNYDEEGLTNQNVTVEITSNEEIQEIEGWQLSEDKLSMKKVYNVNTSETIQVKDLVGNIQVVNINVNNIDKIGPNCLVEYSTINPTNQDIEVVIKSDKEIMPVDGWILSGDNKQLTKIYTENVNENVSVEDLYGNVTVANILINNIDREKPNLEIEYSSKDLTNQNILVTIKANEELKLPSGWSISSDGKEISKYYEKNIQEDVVVEDLAGNQEVANIDISNIDKEAPVVEVNYTTKSGKVEVSIVANEKIQAIAGWEQLSSGNELIKTYETNTAEILEVYDLAGNKQEIEIEIDSFENNLTNGNIQNMQDSTHYNGILPRAGYEKLLIILISTMIIFAIVFYIKYKQYKKIK